MKTVIVWIASLVAVTACGQDDGAPGPADGGVVDGGCRPQSAATFSPVWKPPQTSPNACTEAQIDEAYRRCESASSMTAECTAFSRDPANAECRNCIYSTEDESALGPLVYLRNRVLVANLAGCLALADGNLGPNGCGAHMQAFESCKDAACIKSCTTFDAYQACVSEAGKSVCAPFADDSACKDASTYAACLDSATFEAFYRTLAKVFCGAGFPGGTRPDGGAGEDGGPSADSAMVASPPEKSMFQRIAPGALRTRSTVEIERATGR
jgi:hypothetical protein